MFNVFICFRNELGQLEIVSHYNKTVRILFCSIASKYANKLSDSCSKFFALVLISSKFFNCFHSLLLLNHFQN